MHHLPSFCLLNPSRHPQSLGHLKTSALQASRIPTGSGWCRFPFLEQTVIVQVMLFALGTALHLLYLQLTVQLSYSLQWEAFSSSSTCHQSLLPLKLIAFIAPWCDCWFLSVPPPPEGELPGGSTMFSTPRPHCAEHMAVPQRCCWVTGWSLIFRLMGKW